MNKIALFLMVALMFSGVTAAPAHAADSGVSQGVKSLLIPGWGQYDNGEFNTRSGKMKVGAMAALEIAAIITTGVVGGVVGAPQVWIGIGLFIANHTWSALDAFINATKEPSVNLGTGSSVEKVSVVQ